MILDDILHAKCSGNMKRIPLEHQEMVKRNLETFQCCKRYKAFPL